MPTSVPTGRDGEERIYHKAPVPLPCSNCRGCQYNHTDTCSRSTSELPLRCGWCLASQRLRCAHTISHVPSPRGARPREERQHGKVVISDMACLGRWRVSWPYLQARSRVPAATASVCGPIVDQGDEYGNARLASKRLNSRSACLERLRPWHSAAGQLEQPS